MTMAVCLHLHQLRLAFVAATGGMDMRLISAQALKEKLDRGDPLKLVNALGEWEYRAAHIPGSLHFATHEEALRGLGQDDEIVVHCSNPSCMASVALYQLLERNGYRTFDASPAACRSGRRQAIRWKGRWLNLRATDPGPEQPRRRHAGQDYHPVVGSAEPGRTGTGAWSTRSASSSTPATAH
jgi:rhodanese-related sulfurtransferase